MRNFAIVYEQKSYQDSGGLRYQYNFQIIKINIINGIPRILGYEFNNCRFIGEYYSYSLNMSVRKQLRILDRKELVSGRTFCAYNSKNMSLIIKSRKNINKFEIFQLYED